MERAGNRELWSGVMICTSDCENGHTYDVLYSCSNLNMTWERKRKWNSARLDWVIGESIKHCSFILGTWNCVWGLPKSFFWSSKICFRAHLYTYSKTRNVTTYCDRGLCQSPLHSFWGKLISFSRCCITYRKIIIIIIRGQQYKTIYPENKMNRGPSAKKTNMSA